MGVFDYIRCEVEIPGIGAIPGTFQTKDTPAQYLDLYKIDAGGKLWHEAYEVEDKSEPGAVGMMALLGCRSPVNHRWEPCVFTGCLEFYGETDDGRDIEVGATFIGGDMRVILPLNGPPVGVGEA